MTTLKKDVTSAHLKIIALVCMTLDHIGHAFAMQFFSSGPTLTFISLSLIYYLLRFVGRIAFPLYAFMIAEGCRHTGNIQKYIGLMALFAVISESPFDLVNSGSFVAWDSQNVYFTLLLGLVACYVVRLLREQGKNLFISVPVTAALCASAYVLKTDYSWYGVLLIWLYAITENKAAKIRIPVIIFGLLLIARPWNIILNDFASAYINNALIQFAGSLLSLPLILRYNGQRGNLRVNKYFFYAYYPAHLLIFGLAASLLS